jgi:hypothetical protein
MSSVKKGCADMGFDDKSKGSDELGIQAINPLAAINNMAVTNSEQVDFFSSSDALKISDFMNTHSNSGDKIAKLIATAASKGSSKIHLPLEKSGEKKSMTIDISKETGILQLSAYLNAHPGKAEEVLNRIDDAAKIGVSKIQLPI